MIRDPDIASEKTFQQLIVSELKRASRACDVLESFGLDIAVFMDGCQPKFLEAKAFTGQRNGGTPLGDGIGAGRQIDLLSLPDPRLASLDPAIRWCYADVTRPLGDARYALLTSNDVKSAVMAGVGRGKHNNISASKLRPKLVGWDVFISQLAIFTVS